MSTASQLRIVVWLGAFIAVAGCGSDNSVELTAVRGTVTLNGQPVEAGQITFTPTGGNSSGAAAAPIKNGEYSLSVNEGPMVGTHTVSITASRSTGKKIPAAMPAPPGTMIEIMEESVPAKYNAQTELTAELVSGKNTKDFALEGEVKSK